MSLVSITKSKTLCHIGGVVGNACKVSFSIGEVERGVFQGHPGLVHGRSEMLEVLSYKTNTKSRTLGRPKKTPVSLTNGYTTHSPNPRTPSVAFLPQEVVGKPGKNHSLGQITSRARMAAALEKIQGLPSMPA